MDNSTINLKVWQCYEDDTEVINLSKSDFIDIIDVNESDLSTIIDLNESDL